MINCPNCGNPVREDAKFCGNCGIDVQAALAAQEQAMAAQATAAYQQPQTQPMQPAYPPQRAFGGYDLRRDERSPMAGRLLIVGVLVVAVICAFCCGLLVMAAFFEYFSPAPVRPTPTRQTFEILHTIVQLAL